MCCLPRICYQNGRKHVYRSYKWPGGGVSAIPDRFRDSLRSLTDGAQLTMAQQWNSVVAVGQGEAYPGSHRGRVKEAELHSGAAVVGRPGYFCN